MIRIVMIAIVMIRMVAANNDTPVAIMIVLLSNVELEVALIVKVEVDPDLLVFTCIETPGSIDLV